MAPTGVWGRVPIRRPVRCVTGGGRRRRYSVGFRPARRTFNSPSEVVGSAWEVPTWRPVLLSSISKYTSQSLNPHRPDASPTSGTETDTPYAPRSIPALITSSVSAGTATVLPNTSSPSSETPTSNSRRSSCPLSTSIAASPSSAGGRVVVRVWLFDSADRVGDDEGVWLGVGRSRQPETPTRTTNPRRDVRTFRSVPVISVSQPTGGKPFVEVGAAGSLSQYETTTATGGLGAGGPWPDAVFVPSRTVASNRRTIEDGDAANRSRGRLGPLRRRSSPIASRRSRGVRR